MFEKAYNLLGLPLLLWIPLLPLLGALINLAVGRKMSRAFVSLVGCGTVLLACLVALLGTFGFLYPLWVEAQAHAGEIPALTNRVYDWIVAGNINISLGLRLDPLGAVMALVVTFVGLLIHIYSVGYMAHDRDVARFFGYLNLFTGAMLLLVLGDNLVVLFVGWEGVGVCSYLLIGFWYNKDGTEKAGDANATAGRKAFIVNRIGDFAFILGMFVLFTFTGTLTFTDLARHADALTQGWAPWGIGPFSVAGIAAVLLLIGATGKSAQIPLYVWLPDAMAGPTPVSALIHAATMVTAGVYMVARLNFLYMLSPVAMGLVALIGACTALYAATIGFAQNDIKKVLAYSTISQLGYMFMAVGVGAFAAGIFHLFTHAFFKACLFLCAGSVIHAMSGKQDIRQMGGLARPLPLTHWTFLLSTLAIAGIPLWSGFFSKDEILWKAITQGNPAWPSWYPAMLYILGVLAALCTAFYMFRLYYLTFSGRCRADEETQHHIHESPWTMTMPLVVLAFGATVLGFLGLPSIVGEHANLFHTWLASTVEQGARLTAEHRLAAVAPLGYARDHTLEGALMLLSVIVALVGWLMLARHYYRGGTSEQLKTLVARVSKLHRLVLNKYWIDEVYHALVVQPVRWLARVLADAFDRFIIDIVGVNGSAKLVDVAGQALRLIQSGNVQRYVVALLVGLTALIVIFAGPAASISVKPGSMVRAGQSVTFEADQRGSDQRRLEYQWDFDGDGRWDTGWQDRTTAEHTYSKTGLYKVRLQIRDTRWNRVESGSMTLEVR